MRDLERRRAASRRVPELAGCRCRDPWGHRHEPRRDVAADLDAAECAVEHLRAAGVEPIVDAGTAFGLRRRGLRVHTGSEGR